MNINKTFPLILTLLIVLSTTGCSNKKTSEPSTNSASYTSTAQPTDASKVANSQTVVKTSVDSSNKTSSNTSSANTNNLNTVSQPTAPNFDKPIYIGTNEADVKAMAGCFGSFADYGLIHEYIYKTSQIYFANVSGTFKVIGWKNLNSSFKFTVGDSVPSAPPITLGSTKDQVIKCAGTPITYEISYVQNPNTLKYTFLPDKPINWSYSDGSFVTFDSNFQVIGWHNSGKLRISYGEKMDSAPSIRLGSTTLDILNALGTPRRLSSWLPVLSQKFIGYTDCILNLDEAGNVDGWINNGSNKISMGSKDPASPPFTVGSTMETVIKAMGTPDKVDKLYTWNYGNSIVHFNSDWIVINYTNSGNLKVK